MCSGNCRSVVDAMDSEALRVTYNVARRTVERCFPDELIHFDELWGALEPALGATVSGGLVVPHHEERAAFFAPDKLRLMRLPSCSVIECVWSGVDYYRTCGKRPHLGEFKDFVKRTVGRRHDLTEKQLESLPTVAWKLLKADLSQLGPRVSASEVSEPVIVSPATVPKYEADVLEMGAKHSDLYVKFNGQEIQPVGNEDRNTLPDILL